MTAKRKCGNTVAALQKQSFPKRIIFEKAEAVKKKLTGKIGESACRSGRRGATGPSSLYGNPLRTVRSRDDVQAGNRLLVRGIAARPDAGRCGGMPVSELSTRQDRSAAESRQRKRSVKLQSI